MSDMSDSSDDLNDTPPPDIDLDVKETYNTLLLHHKSKSKYELCYKKFMDWILENGITDISENIVSAYMKKMSNEMKPSTLWTTYSMLKTMINIKNNIDISTYPKLRSFLKLQSNGYKSKKSKILTPEQIKKFLLEAPDREYLFTKVVLIFGISGGCRRQELKDLKINHISDLENELHVKLVDTKPDRFFVIPGMFYEVCKKYIQLRPPDIMQFFVNYQKGKCIKQVVGVNKIGNQPKIIAEYLKLPNADLYTGHCFRRSRITILADAAGDDTLTANNFGVWKSSASVMETYIKHSICKKIEIANIVQSFDTQPEALPSTSNQNIHPNLMQSTSTYNDDTENTYQDLIENTIKYENCTTSDQNIHPNLMQSTTYNNVTEDTYEEIKKESVKYENCTFNNCTFIVKIND